MIFKHRFSTRLAAAALVAAGLAAGCSSVKLDSDVPVESRTGTSAATIGAAGAAAGGTSQTRVTPVDLTDTNTANANAQRFIYFDFDSYVVKDEYRGVVEVNAKALVADRKKHLAIEGHTDERGGREYNLALGQKRSEAVAKALTLLGATDSQIESVSFGKERPAAPGSDEDSWAKNRRVELVYR